MRMVWWLLVSTRSFDSVQDVMLMTFRCQFFLFQEQETMNMFREEQYLHEQSRHYSFEETQV